MRHPGDEAKPSFFKEDRGKEQSPECAVEAQKEFRHREGVPKQMIITKLEWIQVDYIEQGKNLTFLRYVLKDLQESNIFNFQTTNQSKKGSC